MADKYIAPMARTNPYTQDQFPDNQTVSRETLDRSYNQLPGNPIWMKTDGFTSVDPSYRQGYLIAPGDDINGFLTIYPISAPNIPVGPSKWSQDVLARAKQLNLSGSLKKPNVPLRAPSINEGY